MDRILVSACLIGRPVRYNGTAKGSASSGILAQWQSEGRLIAVCPEVAAGFPTPRPPAEIRSADGRDLDGADALAGAARVVDDTGEDVTALFVKGAQDTAEIARRHGCRHAVLTDGSPSCGSTFIYDGTFSGVRKPGIGATVAALQAVGVRVWPETAISDLDALLRG
ncbi:MAG: DUF523 domain-containing protein [Silicimonas sp.]|nr:DUF523 domain-containing protein [Silicimonas sp.]